jgi:hypothetical protein
VSACISNLHDTLTESMCHTTGKLFVAHEHVQWSCWRWYVPNMSSYTAPVSSLDCSGCIITTYMFSFLLQRYSLEKQNAFPFVISSCNLYCHLVTFSQIHMDHGHWNGNLQVDPNAWSCKVVLLFQRAQIQMVSPHFIHFDLYLTT